MKIAILGAGKVGLALARSLDNINCHISMGVRSPIDAKYIALTQEYPHWQWNTPDQVCLDADWVFLALPFAAAQEFCQHHSALLENKIIVDCTNPVAPGLRHGLDSQISGSETLQKWGSNAHWIKCFSIYGYENFDPQSPKDAAHMFYCGNSADIKSQFANLLQQMDWNALDVGPLENALHLEHMTLLWIKMVRIQGYDSRLKWKAVGI